MVAAAIGGSAVLGAGASFFGSKSAASAQSKAADKSIAAQFAMQQQAEAYQREMLGLARSDLAPYAQQGQAGLNELMTRLPELTSPITMDQATLEKTPGYQFNLSQGLRAQQQSATTRGLGLSGAQLKGAADFATGLADNTYQTQFNLENINRTNAYNRLMGVTQMGQNAAQGQANAALGVGTNLSNVAYGTGQGVGNALTGQGDAQAAAAMAAANGVQSGANTVANYLQMNQLMQGMYGNRTGGTTAYAPNSVLSGYFQ